MNERKVYLVTYSNVKYRAQQAALVKAAMESGEFDGCFTYTEEQFKTDYHSFYDVHKGILNEKRGAGFWLWKPYIIYQTLTTKMKPGDVLLYMDCGDKFTDTKGLKEALLNCPKTHGLHLTSGAFPNFQYTKRDCFHFMACDSQKYHNAIQVEAGILVAERTVSTAAVVFEWLSCCLNRAILTDDANICRLQNLKGFIDHRHDQSVLTNLAVRHDLVRSDLLRKHITCNFDASSQK